LSSRAALLLLKLDNDATALEESTTGENPLSLMSS
jgi:hypothetical protein